MGGSLTRFEVNKETQALPSTRTASESLNERFPGGYRRTTPTETGFDDFALVCPLGVSRRMDVGILSSKGRGRQDRTAPRVRERHGHQRDDRARLFLNRVSIFRFLARRAKLDLALARS